MCEVEPDCQLADDPIAKALWDRLNDADFVVRCPMRKHALAAIFMLPSGETPWCLPAISLGDRPPFRHTHFTLVPYNRYGAEDAEIGRCKCGTWTFRPQRANDAAHAWVPPADGQYSWSRRPWMTAQKAEFVDGPLDTLE